MTKIKLSLLGALLLIMSALIPQASAEMICAGHNSVSEKLAKVFDELPTSAGLSSNGGMLEVYTSPDGTWTIVLTRPDGISCLMATGEHWEYSTPELAEIES
ncbi:MAG: hypothetical protein HON65_05620 [Rhodospirillales bacterium]|jgi:hypothetical protein|nr:hypothetical protein [Rhodospirillales bacterium]